MVKNSIRFEFFQRVPLAVLLPLNSQQLTPSNILLNTDLLKQLFKGCHVDQLKKNEVEKREKS